MTLPDTLSLPVVVALVLAGLVLVVSLLRGMIAKPRTTDKAGRRGGRSGKPRDTAQIIAAVQAERDTLRANHAVEIATLEGKLADTQKRVQANLDAELKLKAMDRTLAEARGEITKHETDAANLRSRVESLSLEREELLERVHQVPQLTSDRDRARSEVSRQSEIISNLRNELQETIAKLSRATADRTNQGGAVDTLTRERDTAREEAARLGTSVTELRREIEALRAKAGTDASDQAENAELSKKLANLTEREALLRRTVRERDSTIAELRAAVGVGQDAPKAVDTGEVDRLSGLLREAEGRVANANESLSRLAYDRDGLQSRIASVEKAERDSKVEIEKREALLELRLQKIYELEARLRDQHTQLREAQRRAEMAEESVTALTAAASAGGADGEGFTLSEEAQAALAEATAAASDARIERLQHKLDQVRNENGSLLDELEALRVAASGDAAAQGEEGASALEKATQELTATREAMEALEAENMRLKAAADATAQIGQDEIAALKEKLKTLADRFVADSGVEEAEPDISAEPTLADKIRAFKAARAASPPNGGA
ncbi:hypothetical protein [Acuticoccus kandeliae]|uniref:hypothetical protein n=1 Tax=Acuticoccus kandeliae TaxID=2073160 RepID=UPI001300702B|nr:hypothetical protein [Acuticoccus kandeliae]